MASTDGSDYQPTTILIMLGPLHFEHSGSADVLSVKVSTPDEMEGTMEKARLMVKASTVENLHLVLKSSSISSLFDERVFTTFMEALKPGAEASVHVLGSTDAPVQPADVDEIRYSLLMAGLRLEEEGQTEGDDGGWALKTRKPVIDAVDEGEEEEEEEEEDQTENIIDQNDIGEEVQKKGEANEAS